MAKSNEEIIRRLQTTIGAWNDDVSSAQSHLAQQINQTRDQLSTLARLLAAKTNNGEALLEALDEVQDLKTQLAGRDEAVRDALRETNELERENRMLAEEIEAIRARDEKAGKARQSIDSELSDLRARNQQLKRNLEDARRELRPLRDELAERAETLSLIEAAADEARERADALLRELEALRNSAEAGGASQEALDDLQAKHDALLEREQVSGEALCIAHTERDKALANLQEIRASLDAREALGAEERAAAANRVNELVRALEEREANLAQLNERLSSVDEDSTRLLRELEQLRGQNKELNKKIKNAAKVEEVFGAEIQELRAALEERLSELDAKSAALGETEDRLRAIEGETTSRSAEFDAELLKLREQLGQQSRAFDDAKSVWTEERSQLQSRLKEQDAGVAEARKERDRLLRELQALEASVQESVANRSQSEEALARDLREARDAADALRNELDEYRRERDALQCELDILDADLKETRDAGTALEDSYKKLLSELRNQLEQKNDELQHAHETASARSKSLQTERDAARAAFTALQAETESRREAAARAEEILRAEIGLLNSQAEQRNDEVARVYDELSHLQERAKADTDEKRTLQQEVKNLQAKINDSGASASGLASEIASLRAASAESDAALAAARAESESLAARVESLQAAVPDHERAVDELRALVNTKDAEFLETRHRAAQLESAAHAFGPERESFTTETARLQSQLHAIQEELQGARASAAALEQQLSERSTNGAALKSETDKLRAIVARKDTALQAIEETLAKESAKHRSELAEKSGLIKRSETESVELRKRLDDAAAAKSRVETELASARRERDEHAASVKRAQDELKRAQSETIRMREDLAAKKAAIANVESLRQNEGAAEARRIAAERQTDDLAQQLERARTHAAQRDAEIKALKIELDERAKALREAAHALEKRGSWKGSEAAAADLDRLKKEADAHKAAHARESARLRDTITALEEDLIAHMASVHTGKGARDTSTAKTILDAASKDELETLKAELLAYEAFLIERETDIKAKGAAVGLPIDDLSAADDEWRALTLESLSDPRHASRLGRALVSAGVISRVQLDCVIVEMENGAADAFHKLLHDNDISAETIYQHLIPTLGRPQERPEPQGSTTVLSRAAEEALAHLKELEDELAKGSRDQRSAAIRPDALDRIHQDLQTLLSQRKPGGNAPEISNRAGDLVSPALDNGHALAGVARRDRGLSREEQFQRIAVAAYDAQGRKRSMGEILVNASMISERQLESALEEQRSSKRRRLGTILVEKGAIDEAIVAQVLANQLRLPYVELESIRIESNAANLITGQFAVHHMCIPTRVENGNLTVAMANPVDAHAIRDLEYTTEMIVHPVVASLADISAAIVRYYGVILPETDSTPHSEER